LVLPGADDGRFASLDLVNSNGFSDPAEAAAWVLRILDQLRRVIPRTPNVDYMLRRFDRIGE
jgi:hypothetical protein